MKKYHLRRLDKEITDPALLRKVLKTAQYVTLAMSVENQPYLVSLSHGYDEKRNCIYFHCASEGKKLDYMKSNGNVWGQALLNHGYAPGECTHLYASVQFSGKVKLLNSHEEKIDALEIMMNQLDPNPEKVKERLVKLDPGSLDKTVVGRIDLDYMSGKKSKEIEI